MLIEFNRGGQVCSVPIYVETDKIVGLEFGDFYLGKAETIINLESGGNVVVRGDIQETAARINIAKGHPKA